MYGPALDAQLKPHGLTIRHFPQSFEFSTLGGWIATRSGGHFATLYTHIDDFVESTARGHADRHHRVAALARLGRGSQSGSDVHRLGGNSRHHHRGVDAAAGPADVSRGRVGAVSEHLQGGRCGPPDFARREYIPANCRVLDEGEAFNSGAGNGDEAVLVLAFESADHPLEPWMKRALECCADHGGKIPADAVEDSHRRRGDARRAAGAWRNAFLNAPYLMDTVAAMGMVSDTFETVDHVGATSRIFIGR